MFDEKLVQMVPPVHILCRGSVTGHAVTGKQSVIRPFVSDNNIDDKRHDDKFLTVKQTDCAGGD